MSVVMTDPVALFTFVLVNITITLGYLYLAIVVLPAIPVSLKRTKIGGVGFFLLCGLTHTDMALSALLHEHMSIGEMATSWQALAIHVPQAVCVWMFVTGLYLEVRSWNLVPVLRHPPDDSESLT